ncbi:MAG: Omp28 family outer membrane lipoprotein [Bacteroidota bacterium]|nr:Omp28 family outer membrane lipoprotein [Bacteroidota bacterium]
MKNYKILFLALITILFFSSCDEIEKPYLRDDSGGGGTATVAKKILLEDFTGHRCVNCPGAHVVAHDLQEEYGEQIIVVGVHAGYFAEPSGEVFSRDFTTVAGEQLSGDFQVAQYPSGMINRSEVDGNVVIGQDKWTAAVGAMVQGEAEIKLEIENTYNYDDRKLNSSVDVTFLSSNLASTYNICVYITEDNIIAPQMNNDESIGETPDILEYNHRHVLRKAINGTYGDVITSEAITIETPYTFDFTDVVIPQEWNAEHLSIVAFVIDQANQQVIQAEQLKAVIPITR